MFQIDILKNPSLLTRLVAIVAASTLSVSTAQASSVFADGPGANTPGAAVVTGDITAIATDNIGLSVTASATAFAKPDATHGGFNFNLFSVADADGAETYEFTVTVTNSVGTGSATPTQPPAAGDDIQNIEFELVNRSLAAADFAALAFVAPPATSPAGPFVYTNLAGNSVLRFGGMNGGGLAIPNGGSESFTFNVSVPNATGGWAVRVTANPEPGSMALAGLLCSLAGSGYTLRRRRKNLLLETGA